MIERLANVVNWICSSVAIILFFAPAFYVVVDARDFDAGMESRMAGEWGSPTMIILPIETATDGADGIVVSIEGYRTVVFPKGTNKAAMDEALTKWWNQEKRRAELYLEAKKRGLFMKPVPITVELFDGTDLEFVPETKLAVVERTVREQIARIWNERLNERAKGWLIGSAVCLAFGVFMWSVGRAFRYIIVGR